MNCLIFILVNHDNDSIETEARFMKFNSKICHLFLCSMIWDQRLSFVLLTLVELLPDHHCLNFLFMMLYFFETACSMCNTSTIDMVNIMFISYICNNQTKYFFMEIINTFKQSIAKIIKLTKTVVLSKIFAILCLNVLYM
jgi:hypothetical protein